MMATFRSEKGSNLKALSNNDSFSVSVDFLGFMGQSAGYMGSVSSQLAVDICFLILQWQGRYEDQGQQLRNTKGLPFMLQ